MGRSGKHLVLAGAGHAHMQVISMIDLIISRGHRVTVIGLHSYHYYSGMGPGLLGGTYNESTIRFCSRDQVERRGGVFVEAEVSGISPYYNEIVLNSGRRLRYDVLSCNLGSTVVNSLTGSGSYPVIPVKPISNLQKVAQILCGPGANKSLVIAIVGSGGSAVEVAGNIVYRALRDGLVRPQVILFCRTSLLSHAPEKVRTACRKMLEKTGVVIKEFSPVIGLDGEEILLGNGRRIRTDLAIVANGIEPPELFRNSGIDVGSSGAMAVNRYLQAISIPNVFGGGDCIDFVEEPLERVGVHAVRQNPVLAHNLLAKMENRPLRPFLPKRKYLAIFNLGGQYGVAWRGRFFLKGRFAFLLKDLIDRRFMRRYS